MAESFDMLAAQKARILRAHAEQVAARIVDDLMETGDHGPLRANHLRLYTEGGTCLGRRGRQQLQDRIAAILVEVHRG